MVVPGLVGEWGALKAATENRLLNEIASVGYVAELECGCVGGSVARKMRADDIGRQSINYRNEISADHVGG